MSQVMMEQAFLLMMYSFAAFWIWTMISVGFLLATPKAFLEKYFCPPYFRSAEVIIFSAFPSNLIRNVMFIRLIASPSSGKVRGLSEAYRDVPSWLITYAKVLYISLILVLIWMFGMLAFWGCYIAYDHWLA
jgi:hypothetical protein